MTTAIIVTCSPSQLPAHRATRRKKQSARPRTLQQKKTKKDATTCTINISSSSIHYSPRQVTMLKKVRKPNGGRLEVHVGNLDSIDPEFLPERENRRTCTCQKKDDTVATYETDNKTSKPSIKQAENLKDMPDCLKGISYSKQMRTLA